MKFSIEFKDVPAIIAAGQSTVMMLSRPLIHGDRSRGGIFTVAEVARSGKFWVPEGDVLSPSHSWGFTARGQYVRVPLVRYTTAGNAWAVLFGLGVQIGMAAISSLHESHGVTAEEVYLYLGHECLPVSGDAIEAYIGIAVRDSEPA